MTKMSPAFMPRIVLTAGEPAGIGPDLLTRVAQSEFDAELVAVADPELLISRARMLGIPLQLEEFLPERTRSRHRPGHLPVQAVRAEVSPRAGVLQAANARYVLRTLDAACEGCTGGVFDAMVTAPIHKGIINDAGFAFSGHTEYLAERTGGTTPVMMLATPSLRVALATTHLPLREVSRAITADLLTHIITVLARDLERLFGVRQPRITVCGLNPHAGEGGHLGGEEGGVISPVIAALARRGYALSGPIPADTAFTAARRAQTDAYLAMYHDQGLPVLKALGFGAAVNITLGLPILRTSVDHGTALELAGTGNADCGSLLAAIGTAIAMARVRDADAPQLP